MPTVCMFQLDRVNPVYSSGEYISGRIVLKTDKVKRVNAVYVTLEGEAKVQWSSNNKSDSANYFGHQQYLHTRANVLDNSEFRIGTHVYVLNLHIPPECPSSCKARYGYIAYTLSLIIDKPWSFDEKFHKPITVVQTLDLNLSPEYSLPMKEENVKHFCHWPCQSGPICSTLTLPFSGYVPAQQVPFFLEVDNQSPHYDVLGVEASLRQHFIFMARKPLKRNYFTQTIAKRIIDERTLRLTKRLYEYHVCVPDNTPRSTLNPNYIVFLHYTLQVKLKTGCFHYDSSISVPIVIGTVPLRDPNVLVTTQPTLRRSGMGHLQEHAVNADGEEMEEDVANEPPLETGQLQPFDDPPPSFESCLPPSFSSLMLGNRRSCFQSTSPVPGDRISLPQFPTYSCLLMRHSYRTPDSMLNLQSFGSYGSLETSTTGRSLDTLETNFGGTSDDEDVAECQ